MLAQLRPEPNSPCRIATGSPAPYSVACNVTVMYHTYAEPRSNARGRSVTCDFVELSLYRSNYDFQISIAKIMKKHNRRNDRADAQPWPSSAFDRRAPLPEPAARMARA